MTAGTSIVRSAGKLGIDMRNTVVLASLVLGVSANGTLYQWRSGRWIMLVDRDCKSRRPRADLTRLAPYKGHPGFNTTSAVPERPAAASIKQAAVRTENAGSNDRE